MISYVKGELAAIEEQKAIIDVGGIGYGVFMPHQALAMLPSVGNEVKLYTYLNVREDAMQLFGFLTKDDLEIFRLVIGVSGIGPKGGLNILSCMSPDELRFAIMSGDAKMISSAPGIGKKTAEKLIVELRDKVDIEKMLDHAAHPEETIQTDMAKTSANAIGGGTGSCCAWLRECGKPSRGKENFCTMSDCRRYIERSAAVSFLMRGCG